MSVTIDGAGSLIGVDQGLNIVGLTTLTGGIILDDSISHIGDTNTKIRFPAADTITAETGGTERLRIDSSGRLGLGANNNSSYDAIGQNFLIANESSHAGMTIRSGGSGAFGAIHFADGVSDNSEKRAGRILYSHTDDFMSFHTANTERMRIMSDGTVKIGEGTGNPILMLSASTSGTSVIQMGDTADNNIGQIWYANSNDSMRFFTNNTERLRVDDDGRILVGPGAIATPKCGHAGIDIPNNDWAIIMGGSDGNGNRANNANKDARFAGAHYVNAEEPVGIIRYVSGASENTIYMGGGTSLVNAATQISLYTAANTTTTGGTERLRISSNGKTTIGDPSNSFTPIGLLHLYQASNDPYLYIQRGNGGDSAVDIGGIFFRNSTNSLAGIYARSNDIDDGNLIFQTMGAGTLTERLRIASHGGHRIKCNESWTAANLSECNTEKLAFNINQTRQGQTKAIGFGAIGGNASNTSIQAYDTSNNSANSLLLNPLGGNVGVGVDSPGEHLHISGAVRRDTPGSSNIKFLEFSFELPSGTTTTIATVTGPVVSSMAIAKFEYVGLYDYSGSGFYSGVEMASLRRSSSNSAYTYLQNSEIHAGGNNSSYQPNMFWQNGSNNTSDLMITTGSYVLIVGTIRITTYNLGLSRVISI